MDTGVYLRVLRFMATPKVGEAFTSRLIPCHSSTSRPSRQKPSLIAAEGMSPCGLKRSGSQAEARLTLWPQTPTGAACKLLLAAWSNCTTTAALPLPPPQTAETSTSVVERYC